MTENHAGSASASKAVIRLHPSDSVVVALRDIGAGEPFGAEIGLPGLCAAQGVAQGHKLAIASLAPGMAVHKLGQVIGVASAPIAGRACTHAQSRLYTQRR